MRLEQNRQDEEEDEEEEGWGWEDGGWAVNRVRLWDKKKKSRAWNGRVIGQDEK